jgi:hypothetical protein
LGALAVAGRGGPAIAAHGGLIEGVAVDFTGMKTVEVGAGGGCAVGGAVQNGSSRTVTVRVRYRAWDATGAALLAAARVERVGPGERREFTSAPFTRPEGAVTAPCSALQRVEMLEAVADPIP